MNIKLVGRRPYMTEKELVPIIKQNCKIIEISNCWIWQGANSGATLKDGTGFYGVIRVRSRRMKTHILMFESKFGRVPHDRELDHKCKNTLCCNPDHLEIVTHIENVRRNSRVLNFSIEEITTIQYKADKLRADGKSYKHIAHVLHLSYTSLRRIMKNQWHSGVRN